MMLHALKFKTTMDKFILGENPMRPDDPGLFIIHLLQPVAIFECLEGHVDKRDIFKHYSFQNTDGVIEEWTLSVHHFFTTDFLKEPAEQAAPLMDKAWRWFRSYLEYEDKLIDEDEG